MVHRIQNLRRDAKFELTDRIITYFQGPEDISNVMNGQFADYIRQETLTEQLTPGTLEDADRTDTVKLDGRELTLAVKRA